MQKNGLFRFNNNWYKHREKAIKTTDIYISDIDSIEVMEINKTTVRIKAINDCMIGDRDDIKANHEYIIKMDTQPRTGNNNSEYFILKSSMPFLKNKEEKLLRELKVIIDKF